MDEAVGGASASKEFRERDDKGFRQSEVTGCLVQISVLCLYISSCSILYSRLFYICRFKAYRLLCLCL